MKFFLHILILAVVVHFFCRFMDIRWLWLALGIYGFIIRFRPAKSFWIGFLGVFIPWFSYALYFDLVNNHILSTRIATLLEGLPTFILPLLSGLIGAIGGGLATLCGTYFQRFFPA